MKIYFKKAILIFIVGYLISFIGGAIWDSGELAIMTAICYIGAIFVSSDYIKNRQ